MNKMLRKRRLRRTVLADYSNALLNVKNIVANYVEETRRW